MFDKAQFDQTVSDRPYQDLVSLVQRLAGETIGHAGGRAFLLERLKISADKIWDRYDENIIQVTRPESVLDPHAVTLDIYKAAYLYESVFHLADRGSTQREVAMKAHWMVVSRITNLEDEKLWVHPEIPFTRELKI